MSQINFDRLIAERPDLLNAIGSLSAWLEKRPNVRFIEVPRVAQELSYVPAEDLVALFQAMVDHDLAHRLYQVESPEGDLTGETYSSYSAIPNHLPDRFARIFGRDQGRIVAGFVLDEDGD